MIYIKNNEEIEKMRKAGKIVSELFSYLQEKITAGMQTKEIDKLTYDFILSRGARPACLGYGGFPASICISTEDEVVHGFPSERLVKEDEIISLDVVVEKDGYHADAARSLYVGRISPERKRLIDVTTECFYKGYGAVMEGAAIGDIGAAVQEHAEKNGYSVVREMVGHGIGRHMHEDPSVPNYGKRGVGPRLKKGMAIAIEPMINMGKKEVIIDGWKCVTKDGLPSCHYENTVVLTDNGAEIITL